MTTAPPNAAMIANLRRDVRRFRWLMGVMVVGLVLSGVTAFPLRGEMEWVGRVLDLPATAAEPGEPGADGGGVRGWLTVVRDGLRARDAAFPWLAYGTDWLAFGHGVIALFFVGPMLWPRRDHRWTLVTGMIACAAVLPLAILAGHVRGIPWGWRCIDAAFGVVGLIPLAWAWRIHRRVLGGKEVRDGMIRQKNESVADTVLNVNEV